MAAYVRLRRGLGALLVGLAILPISAFAGVDTLDAQATVEAQEQARPLDDCRVSKVAGPSAVEVLDTDFDVRLGEPAIIEGKCAPFARSHIMGHVYFAGGAAASIADDGTLLSRPYDKSVAKASETVCDGRNHALTYATLVAPLKLVERKDA